MKKFFIYSLSVLLLQGCMVAAKPYTPLLDGVGYLTTKDKPTDIPDTIKESLMTLTDEMINHFILEKENVFVSAPSLILALAMTAQGAKDNTLDQMMDSMKLSDLPMDVVNEGLRALQLSMIQKTGIEFHLTNSIWIRDTFKERVLASFLEANKTYYAPMIASGDFNDPAMVDAINDWVSVATRKKIKTAIDEPIHPLTQMFLINTLYFKGDWLIPFDKANTAKDMFGSHSVDMMAIVENYLYTKQDSTQYIALPYKDSDVMMVIALRQDGKPTSMSQLVASLTTMQSMKVDFKMPRVHTELTLSANEFLKSIGMTDAFDSSVANFDAMATDATKTGLHIANVTQKTFLAIDEKGTEAAAMTKVEMRDESMPMSDVIMHVNRPFTLMIYDPSMNIVYFAGYIQDPTGGK